MRMRLLAAALASVVAVVVTSAPASAHEDLVSSTPAEGQSLSVAPTEVVLTFTDQLKDFGPDSNEVIVADATDTDWAAGPPVLGEATATVPLKTGMPTGDYQIRWRVVSSDGHPISGSISFRIDLPASEPAAPVESVQPSEPSPTPEDTVVSLPMQQSGATEAADLTWLAVVAVFAGIGAIAAIAIVLAKRRGTADGASDD